MLQTESAQAAKQVAHTAPALRKRFNAPFDSVVAQLPAALQTQGFGVLTEIDLSKILRDKLDVSFPRYSIIGACNPTLAHRGLSANPDIGVLLPCNVVVRQEGNEVIVSAVDPETAMSNFGGQALPSMATEVKQRLTRVLERLESGLNDTPHQAI